jgi:hypothetical protein
MEYFMDRMVDFEAVKYKRIRKATNAEKDMLDWLAA